MQIKTFFSANNVYFIKNTNILSRKNSFFQLGFATNEQPFNETGLHHGALFETFRQNNLAKIGFFKVTNKGKPPRMFSLA